MNKAYWGKDWFIKKGVINPNFEEKELIKLTEKDWAEIKEFVNRKNKYNFK